MYLFLSFIVAIMSLYFLCEMATSPYYYTQDATSAVVLLIYSVVTIIKELHKEDDYIPYDSGYHTNTRNYSTSSRHLNNYFDDSPYEYGWYDDKKSIKKEDVEVFTPDKKEEKKEERPKVLHYPSKKEAREKIAKLEKNPLWIIKRNLCYAIGIDITEKYYKPHYVTEEAVVKKAKEDHSRFMPNGNFVSNYENEAYNNIAKTLGRSCDIAFDGEDFVDEEINVNNENESKPCSASVNSI